TLLRAVAATGLLAVLDGLGVEGAADDLVAHAGQVLHTTTAHEHHRVLLQVVALAGDVGGDLGAVGELHTGDLAEGRVRLLRGGRVHTRAHAALLRVGLEGRRLRLGSLGLPALADQLLNGGQKCSLLMLHGDSVMLDPSFTAASRGSPRGLPADMPWGSAATGVGAWPSAASATPSSLRAPREGTHDGRGDACECTHEVQVQGRR